MSAWPRPLVGPAPSPPHSPAASSAPRLDVCRWDAAAVMFFPRRDRPSGPDRPGELPTSPAIDRPAGAAVADAGGPGCG
jgi:hypothetical protein